MRGLSVNGFVISETIGSGRAGVLYLARNPSTGQEAIICLSGAGDDGQTAKIFLEEATSLRPTTRELSLAKTSDGRAAMLAVLPRLPSEAKTLPLPGAVDALSAVAGSPGREGGEPDGGGVADRSVSLERGAGR